MEKSELEYLLTRIDGEGEDTPAEIPKVDVSDWVERRQTADKVDNYCRKYTRADDDPEQAAIRICSKARELLSKNDSKHCRLEYVADLFTGGPRYHDLYPEGWTADTAARILGKVFASRTREEATDDLQKRSNELAEKAAVYKPQPPKAGTLKGAGDIANAVSRAQRYYIGTDGIATYFIPERLRAILHDHTYAVKVRESDGYMWYDGVEWHEDERGHTLTGAIRKTAETVAADLCKVWPASSGCTRLMKESERCTCPPLP